jgi:vacuolar protein sorting-associated protein 54
VVTEKSEVIRTPQPDDGKPKEENGTAVAPRKALATNAILQEKLSWYLDTVEIHLISSISAASQSFFAALGSLKEIHSQAADSVQKIQNLRAELAQLDQDMAMGRLEIIRLRQRRQNLHRLGCATKQMQDVIKGAAHCESLVDQGELETSLDRLAVLEDYICGHLDTTQDYSWLTTEKPEHLIDIRKLKALEGFGRGVNQLRERIGAGFQVRFLDILLSDLRNHVSGTTNNDTLLRWAWASQRYRGLSKQRPSVSTVYLESSAKLRENLSTVLVGLKRAKSTLAAASAFREAISKEMKSIIRRHLPSSSDDDAESTLSSSTRSSRAPLSQHDKSAILARNLRNLGADDAEELLTKAYCGVGEAIRRLQFQCKLLLDLSSDQSLSPGKSPTQQQPMTSLDGSLKEPPVQRAPSPNLQELTEALDLSSLLGQAVDVAQSQINKVLKVRSEQSSRLDMHHFLRYFTLNRLFADECEAVSGRSGAALKGIINAQITDFVHILADSERQSLAQAMESDKWDAKDFNDEDTKVLNNILAAMSSDPPAYISQSYIWDDPHTNGTAPETSNGTPTKKKMRPAIIDEERFILAPSVIFLIHGISRFEILVACMPSIAADLSQVLVDYLKLFNSLSCQLILGAGATRSSASLKRINTKHLALASQALGCVIAAIPYVREFVRRRPGMTSAALGEYDKAKRLYQDHQVSIHEKLVEIMSSRAGAHAKAMEQVDWDADSARPASAHMETLTEETALLQRVLARHMTEATVRGIMLPVFASYKAQWGRAFREARPQTPAGKSRFDLPLFCVSVF